ncbi:MAG: bifunctional 4-hydroxy-3-methylbut-2-enyl diphosphate reductase/30S ribosomal protein S1 [Ruminococcaceae bacterium]|nr:bifunctional 4-hydroxy-3-methylbut-2-enyl diphosphate reductase/30S ribosomal protein S1 [Oscillospiraceae bacterium]
MKYDNPNIIVAENAGFCFGVKRATDTLEKAIKESDGNVRIFTLGHIIHNTIYNNELLEKGVSVLSEDDIEKTAVSATEASPVKIFVRTHGVTKDISERLEKCALANPFFTFEDCTCPFVKKIHKIADEHPGSDTLFIILGDPAHPEVKGIVSHCEGESIVFPDAESLEKAILSYDVDKLNKKTVVLVAQTTQKLSEWHKTQKIIEKRCTNPIIFDTICNVTEIRQLEAAELASVCDYMIVIGGKDSSNTAKLTEICKNICKNTVWVENSGGLSQLIPPTNKKVGIAAGASTPRSIIEEVYKTMSTKIENFEEMLEESLCKTLNTGDTVKGIVTAVSNAELQLDVGYKVTGVIKAEQITDDPSVSLKDMFKVGDEVEAFVIRVSDIEGIAELSKKRTDSDKNWNEIVAAYEAKTVLEGKVIEAVKGGVIALVDATRVFIPGARSGVPKSGDLTTLVGKVVKFRIIEIKESGHRAYGSISDILREERKAKEDAFWATAEEGKQYKGTVKSMTTYGAFVDLGGVDGMIHTSELSWKRIKSPAEVVAIGDEVDVYIKALDVEKKRISLGYKTEATNPWKIFTDKYQVGDIAAVKVVNMMPFGAFAEVVDGVDGLIHISQIALEKIAKPADVLEIGQVVDAKITEIDYEKCKVSLSIRALLEEAKAAEEAMPEDYAEEAPAEEVAE